MLIDFISNFDILLDVCNSGYDIKIRKSGLAINEYYIEIYKNSIKKDAFLLITNDTDNYNNLLNFLDKYTNKEKL